MIIYAHIFFHLRGRIRSIIANDTSKLSRATKFMVMYPAVYMVLTLPIAVGRMTAMNDESFPDIFFVISGSLLTSCGWIDALLYTLTRRVLVSGDMGTGHYYNRSITRTLTNPARPGDGQNYGLQTMNVKDSGAGAHTITITGGAQRMSRMGDHHRSRSYGTRSRHDDMLYDEESATRAGSQDSIIKTSQPNGINIITETSVQVETAEDRDFDAESPQLKEWNGSYGLNT